jgi:hypothetical protein
VKADIALLPCGPLSASGFVVQHLSSGVEVLSIVTKAFNQLTSLRAADPVLLGEVVGISCCSEK